MLIKAKKYIFVHRLIILWETSVIFNQEKNLLVEKYCLIYEHSFLLFQNNNPQIPCPGGVLKVSIKLLLKYLQSLALLLVTGFDLVVCHDTSV